MGTPGGNRPLLFCPQALSKRIEDRYPVVNTAGVKTIIFTKRLVNSSKNPYDLECRAYFDERRVELSILFSDSQAIHNYLLKRQKCICPICESIIDLKDRIEIDHVMPLSKGGSHKRSNMRLLHRDCHRLVVHGKNAVKDMSSIGSS